MQKEKEPTQATEGGCFTVILLVAFAICFCLGEKQWIAEQWKTWGCLIKVCLSPFVVIAIVNTIAIILKP